MALPLFYPLKFYYNVQWGIPHRTQKVSLSQDFNRKKKCFHCFPNSEENIYCHSQTFFFFLWFFLVLCVRDKPAYFAYRLYSAIHVSMAHIFFKFLQKIVSTFSKHWVYCFYLNFFELVCKYIHFKQNMIKWKKCIIHQNENDQINNALLSTSNWVTWEVWLHGSYLHHVL